MKTLIKVFFIAFILFLIAFTLLSGDEYSRRPHEVQYASKAVSPDEIIRSYDLWDNIQIPWGIAKIADTLWISFVNETVSYVCSLKQYNIPLETFTGVIWDVTSVGFSRWMADMCWDSARGLIWELAVGGTNMLYGIDPFTGTIEDTLQDPAFIWTAASQRGVGYDAEEDIFYIGGWNDDLIYKVKGPDWPTPGEIIDTFSAHNCAGLDWDRTTGTVWFGTNDSIGYIIQVDVTTGAHLCSLRAIWSEGWGIAGVEVDDDGTIWHVDMNKKAIYHITSPLLISERQMPLAYEISAHPNPFNSAVIIAIETPSLSPPQAGEMPQAEGVTLEIFDLSGRRVETLRLSADPLLKGVSADGLTPLTKGGQGGSFTWQPAASLASGVYLVRARIDSRSLSGAEGSGVVAAVTKRIVYLK